MGNSTCFLYKGQVAGGLVWFSDGKPSATLKQHTLLHTFHLLLTIQFPFAWPGTFPLIKIQLIFRKVSMISYQQPTRDNEAL